MATEEDLWTLLIYRHISLVLEMPSKLRGAPSKSAQDTHKMALAGYQLHSTALGMHII